MQMVRHSYTFYTKVCEICLKVIYAYLSSYCAVHILYCEYVFQTGN